MLCVGLTIFSGSGLLPGSFIWMLTSGMPALTDRWVDTWCTTAQGGHLAAHHLSPLQGQIIAEVAGQQRFSGSETGSESTAPGRHRSAAAQTMLHTMPGRWCDPEQGVPGTGGRPRRLGCCGGCTWGNRSRPGWWGCPGPRRSGHRSRRSASCRSAPWGLHGTERAAQTTPAAMKRSLQVVSSVPPACRQQ